MHNDHFVKTLDLKNKCRKLKWIMIKVERIFLSYITPNSLPIFIVSIYVCIFKSTNIIQYKKYVVGETKYDQNVGIDIQNRIESKQLKVQLNKVKYEYDQSTTKYNKHTLIIFCV
jgi:hypothetical protein